MMVSVSAIRRIPGLVLGAAAALIVSASGDHLSASPRSHSFAEPVIVTNDRGGRLVERVRQVNLLRRTGQPVQIKGRVCFSTCTLFLSLPQTCVSRDTIFGFHGPSSYGRALDPAIFERASRIIAAHYPPDLKRWYLDTGRHQIRGLYRISGGNIIALGIREC